MNEILIVLVFGVFIPTMMILKRFYAKGERSQRGSVFNKDIKDKFNHLNKMATLIKI